MNILVVAAHPDDEVLGCGGTMARLAGEGHRVSIAILGEGAAARHPRRSRGTRKAVKDLRDHSREAASLLGARAPFLFGLPDNCFDTVPLLDVIRMVEDLIAKLRPDAIYTHHDGDLNVDHAITHRAVLTATRPVAGQPVREVYAFEVPSSTEWAFGRFAPVFRPQRFVDIAGTLARKVKALQCYASEIREFPHPRSPEAVRALAAWRGSQAGVKAAEAFEVLRQVVR